LLNDTTGKKVTSSLTFQDGHILAKSDKFLDAQGTQSWTKKMESLLIDTSKYIFVKSNLPTRWKNALAVD